jgi:hypothetical protein
LLFRVWIRLFEAVLGLFEEIFEAVEQKRSRKYASPYAERLFGQPVLTFATRTAPDWTAYGRVEGTNR